MNAVTGIADLVQTYGTTVVVMFIFGSNYVRKECIIEALNEIHIVDNKLVEFGFVLLFVATVMACVEYLDCYLFISAVMSSNTFCNLICVLAITIIVLEEIQFFTYILLLKHRFKLLNSLLINKFAQNKKGYEKINCFKIHPMTIQNGDKGTIVKLRSLHLRLCFAGKLLNEYFSIQILLVIGFAFVGFTTNAYYSFDVISDNFINNNSSFDDLPTTIIWTFAKFAELLSISVICAITKNEVNQTGEILYQLKQRFKKTVATQIHLFGKQIMHCDFKFTAFDFFNIDMTLFYGVIGSAATYLTVLIQFEIAAKRSNKNDSLHYAVTGRNNGALISYSMDQ
ncbi:hypothetical protein Zmor_020805 [Zophobas morio]|uniref:Gustatory receptor n=1 Tax=Zophobas morio TaxID=2755281 RepID=A0AA38MA22_9CUCU|nr:hypothetical protein Zmor_020805 [Zophobas morio]